MPRKEGQKRKLLVLLEILARETDEKHPSVCRSWWKSWLSMALLRSARASMMTLAPSAPCPTPNMRLSSSAAAAGII